MVSKAGELPKGGKDLKWIPPIYIPNAIPI
jgi:hypothetical protein